MLSPVAIRRSQHRKTRLQLPAQLTGRVWDLVGLVGGMMVGVDGWPIQALREAL